MLKWFENHLLPCAYKSLFGIDCPVCGAQRSLLLLCKGEWKASFLMYPPLIPVLLFLFLLFCRVVFYKQMHIKYIHRFSVLVLAIIAINYSAKLIIGHNF